MTNGDTGRHLPLKHGDGMKNYLFICSVNGWNRASDNGIMVILSDASVSGRNSGNNVGYDGLSECHDQQTGH